MQTRSYSRRSGIRRVVLVAAAVVLPGCAGANLQSRHRELSRELASPPVDSQAEAALASLDGDAPLTREALVRAVLARNPSIESAREAARAALARVPQKTALDDPRLMYELAPFSAAPGGAPFGQSVQLSQMLPFPGKRSLEGRMALAEAEAARGELEQARQQLAFSAVSLLADLYLAERALEVNAHHVAVVEELKSSAEAQYAVGRASQQDPLQAEVELAQMQRERAELQANRDVLRAQLNALLHRPSHAKLPPVAKELSVDEAAPLPLEALQNAAVANRPELASLRAQLEGGDAAIARAKREYLPDFEVMASYSTMWMDLPHRPMVGVGLNLPLQLGRRSAAVDEAEALRRRASSEEARMLTAIRSEVDQARRRLEESLEVLRLYRERLLPATRAQLQAARAGFVSARSTFQSVVEADRNVRQVELGLHASLAEVERRSAALARATGITPGLTTEGAAR